MSTGGEPSPLGNVSHTLHPSLKRKNCLQGVLNLNKTTDLRKTLFLLYYTDVRGKKSPNPKHHYQLLCISKHLLVSLTLETTLKKETVVL